MLLYESAGSLGQMSMRQTVGRSQPSTLIRRLAVLLVAMRAIGN
jgi:hypothetical protein